MFKKCKQLSCVSNIPLQIKKNFNYFLTTESITFWSGIAWFIIVFVCCGLFNTPDSYLMYALLLNLLFTQRSGMLFVLPDMASITDISFIVSTKDSLLSSLPMRVSASTIWIQRIKTNHSINEREIVPIVFLGQLMVIFLYSRGFLTSIDFQTSAVLYSVSSR